MDFPSVRGLRFMTHAFLSILIDITSWPRHWHWEKLGTGRALMWLGGPCISDILLMSHVPFLLQVTKRPLSLVSIMMAGFKQHILGGLDSFLDYSTFSLSPFAKGPDGNLSGEM